MSELLEVAAALTRAAGEGHVCVLATVVRTEGSTYRRIGARLVVLGDASHVGAVSAGCIETDVVLRAERVRSAMTAEVTSYDTRSPDDLIWGLGVGCGGSTELLLEPLDPEQALARAGRLRHIADLRGRSLLATVIRASGLPLEPGDQAMLHAGPDLIGFAELPAHLRAEVVATARHQLRIRSSCAVLHTWADKELDIAYEVRSARVHLCVCGAGPDAVPLVALAQSVGWQVTLIDHRPALLSPERWPAVECRLVRASADIGAVVETIDCDAAVVMNHHYERDLDSLAAWLRSAVPFIGMVGPRTRTGQMLATLITPEAKLEGAEQRIHAPVGLDLGGETAAEIALSIVAEIKASLAGRSGGPLRDRDAPIHDPVPARWWPLARTG